MCRDTPVDVTFWHRRVVLCQVSTIEERRENCMTVGMAVGVLRVVGQGQISGKLEPRKVSLHKADARSDTRTPRVSGPGLIA